MMCPLLEVSTSGYYDSLTRVKSKTKERQESIEATVVAIFHDEKRIPGYRKIHRKMKQQGHECSAETVRSACRRVGVASCVQRKSYRPKTTDSKHSNRVDKNVLNRDFTAERPNEKWLTDITYIETNEGFVYLSAIIDLYSRRVIAWNIETHMRTELVIETVRRAIQLRGVIPDDLLFHMDRGIQYTAAEFRACLKLLGITQSMSGKGDCWDNAPCESFWGKLKTEWIYQRCRFKNLEEAKLAIFEYVEGYYYNTRLHQSLDYQTPRQVEEKYFAENSR